MTDLTQIIINIFSFNSIVFSIMILSITLFGVIVGGMGLIEGYAYTTGNSRFSTRQASFSGALMKLAIGSAAAVGAVIFYQIGGTFSLGQNETTRNVLDYAQNGSISGTYCQQFHYSVTIIWMLIGTVALFNAARTAYRKSNGEMITWGQPILYLLGGIMCYFVNDITSMAANTIGLQVGLDNLCKAFGMAGAG
ncbi:MULTISPECIES: hypothetical protein [Hyphomicrobiales]|uniref:hypothetical protein n=1 Tax=Hyphomicrobiales TaxID=356 RepID=UPI000F66E16C|nr:MULTISPECIES: hypothetical protein [Hyphomicrobiales]MCQ9147357.1 hypothetical protein [Ochrobactrum sp. BTU2]MDH1270325.1 hypothetical protein [Agrobacterium pusense]MDX4076501.1 hypothetical protein [Brucella sp. NBRC 113783]RSC24728.1 hypothetical protein EGT36_28275 [Agrobacterium sp. FDAARGOS_525]